MDEGDDSPLIFYKGEEMVFFSLEELRKLTNKLEQSAQSKPKCTNNQRPPITAIPDFYLEI